MEKRLKNYLAAMDDLLASLEGTRSDSKSDERNAEDILREHLAQIHFFQHERLIHLIVTCLFAVLAFAVFFALFFTMNVGLFVLFAVILVLLVPYIRHYYILENGVQRMYNGAGGVDQHQAVDILGDLGVGGDDLGDFVLLSEKTKGRDIDMRG